MAKIVSVDNAYVAYRKALQNLYIPHPESDGPKYRSSGKVSSDEISQRALSLLNQSRSFGDALVNALETNDPDQRELAGWKLLAAAASDLSASSDLLEAHVAESMVASRRRARSGFETVPELILVLETPLEGGFIKLTKTTRKTLFMPKDSEAAKEQLKKTIAIFLDEITDSAASISKAATGEVLAAGLNPARQIISNLAQEMLEHLPATTSYIIQHAASLLAEAIRKIEAALGESITGPAKEEVASWLKDIAGVQDKATKLLNKLYEVKRIEEEISVLLISAPKNTPADRYNQATQTLEDLLARNMVTSKVLEGVMRVLGFVKAPLLAAVPWGPIGLYGTYFGILAYAIFNGGDYLDWYRLGEKTWLNRVAGLRTTVRNSLEKKENLTVKLQSPKLSTHIRLDQKGAIPGGGGKGFGFQTAILENPFIKNFETERVEAVWDLPTEEKKRIISKSTKVTLNLKGEKKGKATIGENVRLQKVKKKRLIEEKIRLDVQTPERVIVEKTFEIAVAVRQPKSPLVKEPDMPKAASKTGKIFRETFEDIIKYRVKVSAPECKVHTDEAIFLLTSGNDSETHYFQLTARKEGNISILVQAYQENEILAADTRISLTATLEAKPTVFTIQKDKNMNKAKILFFASNPQDTNILDLGKEVRTITRKIRESECRDSLEFVTAWATQPTDLLNEINRHNPSIVHFSGHGSAMNGLILTDDQDNSQPVSTEALEKLFSTVKGKIQLVFLNACFTDIQGQAISRVIDCVVGMKRSITNKAAIVFAAYFYSALGNGCSIKDAFDQGVTALMLEGIPEDKIPVLLSRRGTDPAGLYLVHVTKLDYNKILKIDTDSTGNMILQDINGSTITVDYNDVEKLKPVLKNLSDAQTFEMKQLIGSQHKEVLTEIRRIQDKSDEENTIQKSEQIKSEQISDGIDDFFKELTAMKIESAKNRLITNYKLLREYEELIILEEDPKQKMRYQKEIEIIKSNITSNESELKSMVKQA